MSTSRDDFYQECKGYCHNIELIETLDQLIFNADYDDKLDKKTLEMIRERCVESIKSMERQRVGWVLYDDLGVEKND